MISILKCIKQNPNKLIQKNIKPIRETFIKYSSNNFFELKELLKKYFTSNEAKVLQDVILKQEHLEKVQDERREIGKLMTNDHTQQFIYLRKEEAELIRKEHELIAKFEAIDKHERELFNMLGNTIRVSYEREKVKIEYTKFLYIISTVIVIVCSQIFTSKRVEEKPSHTDNEMKVVEIDIPVFWGIVGLAIISLISGTCR